MPRIVLIVVLLPEPLWPRMVTISPSPTCKLRSKITCLRPYPPYRPSTTSTSGPRPFGDGAGPSHCDCSDSAKVRLRQPRAAREASDRALRRHPAELHEVRVVREPADDMEVVLDDADRAPLALERLDEGEHALDPLRV